MIRFIFVLLCGFLLGAIVMENKQYFSKSVISPVASFPDGGLYEGTLTKGELNGVGQIVWPNGNYYSGEFKKGLYHGVGRLQMDDFLYEGDFVAGVAKGKGVINFQNGDYYQGDIDQTQANGIGTLSQEDGSEYTGEFKNNLFHGQGVYRSAKGDIYEGDFYKGIFQGQGIMTTAEEKVYQGEFIDWLAEGAGEYRDNEISYTGSFEKGLFEGQGKFKDQDGEYSGEFKAGAFHGIGEYLDNNNNKYIGAFEAGRFHGNGILTKADGERYEGGFEYGFRHGEGILFYAKPLDGIAVVKGTWKYDKLVESDNPLVEHNPQVIVEDVLYWQKDRLDFAISKIEDNNPEAVELYLVAIAGDGSQGVFRREIDFIVDTFDNGYGTKNKSLKLINGNFSFKKTPLATITSINKALNGVVKKMDGENDILLVYFTSHGSRDFNFQLSQQGLQLADLSAEKMGEIIHALPIKHKVIVISSCFSGGFIPSVKDDNTMVISAASADKTSFGCSDTSEMTYFGEAFFKDALPQSASFDQAFDTARTIIKGREAKEGYEFSEPLIFKPKSILEQLIKWRQQLQQTKLSEHKKID
jgi:hypothetical protein